MKGHLSIFWKMPSQTCYVRKGRKQKIFLCFEKVPIETCFLDKDRNTNDIAPSSITTVVTLRDHLNITYLRTEGWVAVSENGNFHLHYCTENVHTQVGRQVVQKAQKPPHVMIKWSLPARQCTSNNFAIVYSAFSQPHVREAQWPNWYDIF